MRGGKPGHNDRLGQKTVGGKANSQVIDTEQDNRKNQIDGRTSKRNESTLPALLREKLVGRTRGFLVAGVDIGDVLSGHADVTAEREGADAPIRCASFNAKKPRTEADGKDINANAKEARDDKMSPFVNQDYDAEDKDDTDKSVHASDKLRQTILAKKLCHELSRFASGFPMGLPRNRYTTAAFAESRATSSEASRRASASAARTSSMDEKPTRGVRARTRSIASGIPRNGIR